MHDIFIDTDIIIDVLTERNPHYIHAAKLFTLAERNNIKAYTSPIIIANIHYILSKLQSPQKAIQSIQKIKTFIKILPVDDKIIELALSSNFNDFEDAIQYYTAKSKDIQFLVTRNKKDYKVSDISICTAEEYINIWLSSKTVTDNKS